MNLMFLSVTLGLATIELGRASVILQDRSRSKLPYYRQADFRSLFASCVEQIRDIACDGTVGSFWLTYAQPSCPYKAPKFPRSPDEYPYYAPIPLIDYAHAPLTYAKPPANKPQGESYTSMPSWRNDNGNYEKSTATKPPMDITQVDVDRCIQSIVTKTCDDEEDEFWRTMTKQYEQEFCGKLIYGTLDEPYDSNYDSPSPYALVQETFY